MRKKGTQSMFASIVSLSAKVVTLDDERRRLERKLNTIAFEARADERARLLPRWFFGTLAVMVLMFFHIVSGFLRKKSKT